MRYELTLRKQFCINQVTQHNTTKADGNSPTDAINTYFPGIVACK